MLKCSHVILYYSTTATTAAKVICNAKENKTKSEINNKQKTKQNSAKAKAKQN